MQTTQEKLFRCLADVKKHVNFQPEVAMILGSGWGEFGESMEIEAILPYGEIDGFPVSTVSGHAGRFLFGRVGGVHAVIMQGRVHYYEGYSMQDVVLPVRLMGLLGAKVLLLTNAAGSVNLHYHPGDLMLITDQITSFVPSPLIGANLNGLGPRFPDMSHVYDEELCEAIRAAGRETGIPLREGVYIQFTGPQFETPAEIRMARLLGADAVGMSTACEAIAAHHMGMRVCGISCISNYGCGISKEPLSAYDVNEMTRTSAPRFRALGVQSVKNLTKFL